LSSQTFVDAVKCRENDDEECRRVFPGVDEMWKCQSSVTVTTQALRETKPRRQGSNQRTYAVPNTSAESWTYDSL